MSTVGVHNTEYIVDDSFPTTASWDAQKYGGFAGTTSTPTEWRVMARNKSRESMLRKSSGTTGPTEEVYSPMGAVSEEKGAGDEEKGGLPTKIADQRSQR